MQCPHQLHPLSKRPQSRSSVIPIHCAVFDSSLNWDLFLFGFGCGPCLLFELGVVFVFLTGENVSIVFSNSWTNCIKFPHFLVAFLDGCADEVLVGGWPAEP